MEPEVGCSKPAIRRRQVVLPEPDGPSMEKNSPSWISMLTWSTALTSPKARDTLVNCTARVIVKLQDKNQPATPGIGVFADTENAGCCGLCNVESVLCKCVGWVTLYSSTERCSITEWCLMVDKRSVVHPTQAYSARHDPAKSFWWRRERASAV